MDQCSAFIYLEGIERDEGEAVFQFQILTEALKGTALLSCDRLGGGDDEDRQIDGGIDQPSQQFHVELIEAVDVFQYQRARFDF